MDHIARVLVGLLVLTLPFDQAFALPFIGSLNRAVGLLAAAAGLLALVSGTTVRLRRFSAFVIVSMIFVAWNALSIVWSLDRAATATQAFTYVQLWILIWLIWQFVNNPRETNWLRQSYMAGVWIALASITWNYFSGNPTVDVERFSAFQTNANYTAQSVALAIPMAFDAAVHERGFPRLMALLLIPACIFGIFLTASRSGGFVAAVGIVGGVLLIVRSSPWIKALIFTGVITLITVLSLALPARTVDRFVETFTQIESLDLTGRGDIWKAGGEAWLYRPALGAGAGTFYEAVVSTLGHGHASHNSFIGLLVELGPLGPTLFLALFFVAALPHLQTLVYSRQGKKAGSLRFAVLHLVLLSVLLVAQLPANWQYQRVTWFILVAATLDRALLVRNERQLELEVAPNAH